MEDEQLTVIFANKALDQDFKRLSTSENPEDKRLYAVLRRIIYCLRFQYQSGDRLQSYEISDYYKNAFQIDNLWKIDLGRDKTVLYSVVGREIWILDLQ